jgi:hypothetical protein
MSTIVTVIRQNLIPFSIVTGSYNASSFVDMLSKEQNILTGGFCGSTQFSHRTRYCLLPNPITVYHCLPYSTEHKNWQIVKQQVR